MNLFLVIFGMMVVTYIPRVLPALFMDRFQFPVWFQRWLKSIPYAALGALIFPGILLVDKEQPIAGIMGGIVAAVLAYAKAHIVFIMTGAILAVLIAQKVL